MLINSLIMNVEESQQTIVNKKPESYDPGFRGGEAKIDCDDSILSPPPNFFKGEGGMSKGFIQINRELFDHPTFISAPPAYCKVLMVIISNACFAPCQYDDEGVIINLLPGQLCTTVRQLAKDANVTKNDVERALRRFLRVEILRQEVRHRKTIITLSSAYIFYGSETRSETKVRQSRDKSETQKNKANKANKAKKETSPTPSFLPNLEKIKFREFVKLTQSEYESLLAKHGKEFLDQMLDVLDAYKGSSGKEYDSDFHTMKQGGWVVTRVKQDLREPRKPNEKPSKHNPGPHASTTRRANELVE